MRPVVLSGAASATLRPVLTRPARQARWLGATPAALYLGTAGEPGVVAVLSHDAVRLPCGVLLASTWAELPLSALAPDRGRGPGPCLVGDGMVSWTGPHGPVVVSTRREWTPRTAGRGPVSASALAQARGALRASDNGVGAALAATLAAAFLATDDTALAVRLLGHGPGLTPAGDDVLAGFLAGAYAFGTDVSGLRAELAASAPEGTSALSAALLWHAARGQCIDEVADMAVALTGGCPAWPATMRLLAVGHSSGAALAWGLVLAAEQTLRSRDAG